MFLETHRKKTCHVYRFIYRDGCIKRPPQYIHRQVLSPEGNHKFSFTYKECNILLATFYLGSYCL